jgi:hypothetical protein
LGWLVQRGLPDLAVLAPGGPQLGVRRVLQREQGVVRLGQCPEDLVQLALSGGLMAGLGVLDDEHHGHGDRRDQ